MAGLANQQCEMAGEPPDIVRWDCGGVGRESWHLTRDSLRYGGVKVTSVPFCRTPKLKRKGTEKKMPLQKRKWVCV